MEAKVSREMKVLLKTKLTEEEKQRLKEDGFTFKNPTKQTLLLVALYKKAANGDMTAIREINAMIGSGEVLGGEGVRIIDNVDRFIS